jgi:hypothetical protein
VWVNAASGTAGFLADLLDENDSVVSALYKQPGFLRSHRAHQGQDVHLVSQYNV